MALRIHNLERPELDRRHRGWAWRKAITGELPAEIITNQGDREQLVHELWQAGWTDVEIATHTLWSTYTVARIRERLGMLANRVRQADSGTRQL